MNAFVVLSAIFAAAQASLVTPYSGVAINAALPYGVAGAPLAAAIPAGVPAAVPAAIPAPYAYPSSQFQAQDEFGNLNYGYSNINSVKQEVGNAYGGVTGSYSYVDAYGIPQRVDYIADGLGFRVKATNLPVAPATPAVAPLEAPVFEGVAPEPVMDTPEVAAAKAEHAAAIAEASSRKKRSAILPYGLNYGYAGLNYGVAGLNYGVAGLNYGVAGLPYAGIYGYGATVAATPAAVVPSVPATREAVLTKIKLNPGHATAYIVN